MARIETAPLAAQTRWAAGSWSTRLFNATDEAGLPDSIATQLAEVFATEINFHRDLRRGDTFSVVYETLTADGEPITWNESAGRVLAAEFVNKGESHSAIWFESTQARSAWRLFRPERPQQAALFPGQPDGVLAGDLRLRDALSSDPAETGASTRASTTAHRAARRFASSAMASWSSPAGRTGTAMWWWSSTLVIAARCMRT